jgi:hypothetical protein
MFYLFTKFIENISCHEQTHPHTKKFHEAVFIEKLTVAHLVPPCIELGVSLPFSQEPPLIPILS